MFTAIFATIISLINFVGATSMRIEVKWFGGRFLPYGKPVSPTATAFENAIAYITNASHAAYYALPCVMRGGKSRKGKVFIALYSREQVLAAVKAFEASGKMDYGALGLHNGGVALMRAEAATIRTTFGKPQLLLDTALTKRSDLQPDAGCPNAPYARAWEKVCAQVLDGTWTGALKNVQVDVVLRVNETDD